MNLHIGICNNPVIVALTISGYHNRFLAVKPTHMPAKLVKIMRCYWSVIPIKASLANVWNGRVAVQNYSKSHIGNFKLSMKNRNITLFKYTSNVLFLLYLYFYEFFYWLKAIKTKTLLNQLRNIYVLRYLNFWIVLWAIIIKLLVRNQILFPIIFCRFTKFTKSTKYISFLKFQQQIRLT